MSADASSAQTIGGAAHVGTVQQAATGREIGPWPILWAHARAIAVALLTCLVVLVSLELALFRSGFFAAHATVTDPQWPAAKLAVAARQPDASVLYVGDSTMMTSVLPAIVTRACACGPGFNGGFSSADPWLTDAMTHRLLAFMHPKLVVVSISPWTVDNAKRFVGGDLARQVMSPAELAANGAPLDLAQAIDTTIGDALSVYGQREVLKEWLSSLMPGQRYDETLLGYYVAPGAANTEERLVATAGRLFTGVGAPSASAPGAVVIRSLVEDLRARGIAVAFLLPPLHPAAYSEAGAYLAGAEVAIRELATEQSVPLIDCRAVASASDFRDVTHLLEPAAERHSACVGERLRAIAGG